MEQYMDEYMMESEEETGLWIKNNTSVNIINTKMNKEI